MKLMTYIGASVVLSLSAVSGAQAQETAVDQEAILAALGEAYTQASVENGARVFRRCQACHTLDEGAPNRVGPNLYGVFQNAPASVDGFRYSNAFQNIDFEWTAETMDEWLTNPRAFLRGNRMSFAGLRDETQRRDVIAYLAVQTHKPTSE